MATLVKLFELDLNTAYCKLTCVVPASELASQFNTSELAVILPTVIVPLLPGTGAIRSETLPGELFAELFAASE